MVIIDKIMDYVLLALHLPNLKIFFQIFSGQNLSSLLYRITLQKITGKDIKKL